MEEQLTVAERNRNDLEADMLKKSTAEAEIKTAKEMWLKASDQWNKLAKEAEEAKRQLHEVDICGSACGLIITCVIVIFNSSLQLTCVERVLYSSRQSVLS